jgi:uncharacterized protein YwqG
MTNKIAQKYTLEKSKISTKDSFVGPGIGYYPDGFIRPNDMFLILQINLADFSLKNFPPQGILQLWARSQSICFDNDDHTLIYHKDTTLIEQENFDSRCLFIPAEKMYIMERLEEGKSLYESLLIDYKEGIEHEDDEDIIPFEEWVAENIADYELEIDNQEALVFIEKVKNANHDNLGEVENMLTCDDIVLKMTPADIFDSNNDNYTDGDNTDCLGGLPFFLQNEEDMTDALQLFQISGDGEETEIGSCGMFHLLISEDDLKNNDLEKSYVEWSCY